MLVRLSCFCIIIFILSCAAPTDQSISNNTKASVEETIPTIPESSEGRAAWQKPKLIVDKLGDLSDKVVADLGAGTGYFAFRLVFKSEKVIALDIDPEMISIMEDLKNGLPQNYQDKFETRLALLNDSKLEKAEADIILIINTIAYIDNRIEYLTKLKSKLRKNGKIIVIDFKMKNIKDINAPSRADRLYVDVLEDELLLAGYKKVITDDQLLEYQYITTAYIDVD